MSTDIREDAFRECERLEDKNFHASIWWKHKHWNCADCLKKYRHIQVWFPAWCREQFAARKKKKVVQ